MSKVRRGSKKSPHYGVYCRLKPSKLHGIGVFAIQDIKKGTDIFFGDDEDLIWIKKSNFKNEPKEIRKLYEDFAVIEGDRYGCPRNFNLLAVAWYLNESKHPNVGCNKNDFRFVALRDIKAGEELTADYDTYSDRP